VTSGALEAGVLLDADLVEDPYPLYRRLREEAPVWLVPGTDIVAVSSFSAICEAIGRPEDFSSEISALLYRDDGGLPARLPFGGAETQALATADPPAHGIHRGAVFPELMNRRMAELRSDVDALACDRLRGALEESPVEFMAEVANTIPIRVVSRLIGWQDEDPDKLLAAAFDSTSLLSATRTRDELEEAIERIAVVGVWIAEQLEQAFDAGSDGLLGVIADSIHRGELDFLTGVVILQTLLSAGGESTTSLLGNAIHLLAGDADLQALLRSDPELLTPFIEEVLRLESPFRYHLRQARHATELQGTAVPAGATLLLLWGAANRDPAEYDRPDDVVLDRPTPRHHLGFGRGIHLCVGAPLARLEADVVLSRFLEMTSSFTLDPDRPAQREDSLMIRRFTSLPLLVER
jgi:cytochrome P450